MNYNDDIQSKVVDLYNTTSKSLSSLPSLSSTEYNNTELLYTKISNFSGSVLNSSSLASSPLSSYLNDNDLSVNHNGTYYNPSNLAVTATRAAILIDENLIDRISTEFLTSSSSSSSSVSTATTVATKFLSSSSTTLSAATAASASTSSSLFTNDIINQQPNNENDTNNYWALLALILVFGTAAGNILVCLAIAWERRLQNVTNYFLMSLAITDLMVAILVMPLGILTLVKGYFPLESEHCLVWICLDVLFCTASIMHLCTISVDRYLSLRYPMRFGRNKTRRRVTLKIVFVWLLSIAMSLPLSLMYSQDHSSVLVNGTCQIPDPVYKLVGSIVCFYIPLGVMLLTYCLTVRLLAQQRQNLGGTYNQTTSGWASGWLGQTPALERRCTWRRLLKANQSSTPNHAHSGTSTDTELSTLDTHELWLPDSSIPEPTPSTMTALHQFGAEMLKLSRGLESVGSVLSSSSNLVVSDQNAGRQDNDNDNNIHQRHQHFSESNIPSSIIRNANTKNTINNNDSLKNQQTVNNYYPKSLSAEQTKNTFGKKNIRQRSQSSSSFTRRFNALRKRRASTSSSSSPYENRPGTPPPIARKRFHSLPKNTLVLQNNNNNNNSTGNDHETSTSTTSQIMIKDQSLSHSSSPNSNLNSNEMNTVVNDNHFITENNVSEKICYDKNRHRVTTDDYLKLPPPCTCPYFGDRPLKSNVKPAEVKIISTSTFRSSSSSQESDLLVITSSSVSETGTTITTLPIKSPTGLSSTYVLLPSTPTRKLSYSKTASVVTWDSGYIKRRGSSFGGVKTSLISTPTKIPIQNSPLRRSATLRNHNSVNALINNESSGSLTSNKTPSSPCILQRNATIRSHHSRNSSVISRNSSRHGRIIRLEQKATKVLGVVFFTFVILWAPFFVLNLVPSVCGRCEKNIAHWVFDVVTWLGYASSMVNPIFYTIFNKVFRQAFKKVLLCKYGSGSATSNWRPNR